MEGINFGEFSAECPEITRDLLCLCNLLRDFPDKYVVCLTSKLPEFYSAGESTPLQTYAAPRSAQLFHAPFTPLQRSLEQILARGLWNR